MTRQVMREHTMAVTTRDRLISAANDLFYEHGFHAVGLDQVLAKVRVTKTTFYNHFESKDALVIAVLLERDRVEFAEWLRFMETKGGNDPASRILALFDLLEDWLADESFKGCMFLKALAEYPNPTDPVHQAALIHGNNLQQALAHQAKHAGSVQSQDLANQLMMVLTGAILTRHTTGMIDRARTARATAGVIVSHHLGLAPSPS